MTHNIVISDKLYEAAKLLKRPGGWTKRCLAKNKKGDPVSVTDPEATCFCALGAIYRVCNIDIGQTITLKEVEALELIFDYTHYVIKDSESIIKWNDKLFRTQSDVVRALTTMADIAKKNGH